MTDNHLHLIMCAFFLFFFFHVHFADTENAFGLGNVYACHSDKFGQETYLMFVE